MNFLRAYMVAVLAEAGRNPKVMSRLTQCVEAPVIQLANDAYCWDEAVELARASAYTFEEFWMELRRGHTPQALAWWAKLCERQGISRLVVRTWNAPGAD